MAETSKNLALCVKDISKSYGDIVALKDVSLFVNQGETFGLLGPNGAGKTTLISIISGVEKKDSGEIEFMGEVLKEPTAKFRRSVGVIPQEISLYDKLSGRENLEFFGSLYGIDRSTLKNKIDETLLMVGLADRQSDKVGTYSGGMKRRINIAASILHSPQFILMDEPTVGIDPQSRNLIFEVIEKLHRDGITIVYTSHYMEEVERLCQRIAIMDHGKVVACGTLDELIALTGRVGTVEIQFDESDKPKVESYIKTISSMAPIIGDSTLVLSVEDGNKALGGIITGLANAGVNVKRVQVREPNLEHVFLKLTGKELRD
jgi:ABC-2 type transport system ATP-binding protein